MCNPKFEKNMPSIISDNENVSDFPRGGGSGLTNLEEREIRHQVEADLEAMQHINYKTKKRLKKIQGHTIKSADFYSEKIDMDTAPNYQKSHLYQDALITIFTWKSLQGETDLTQWTDLYDADSDIPGVKNDHFGLVGLFWRRRGLNGILPVEIGKLSNLEWLYYEFFLIK